MNVFMMTGPTVNLTAGTTSGAVAISTGSNGPGFSIIRIRNTGTVEAFVEFGGAAVTATTSASAPVAPGTVEAFRVPQGVTHAAAVTASGSAIVYFTPGEGA